MPKSYLFDSNILVHMVRESSLADYVRQTYSPLLADPRPAISVVTDTDFDHLQPTYISSIDWIDPEQFRE